MQVEHYLWQSPKDPHSAWQAKTVGLRQRDPEPLDDKGIFTAHVDVTLERKSMLESPAGNFVL